MIGTKMPGTVTTTMLSEYALPRLLALTASPTNAQLTGRYTWEIPSSTIAGSSINSAAIHPATAYNANAPIAHSDAPSKTILRPRWSAIQPPHGYASVEISPPKPPSEFNKPSCDMLAPSDKTNG